MIVRVEVGVIVSHRALVLGCNARLPVHGAEIRETLARLTLSTGETGFGWTSLKGREEAQRLLGMQLSDLISVERGGVSNKGLPVEGALWDLLGHVVGQPVCRLLAAASNSARSAADFDVYFTHLCLSDLGIEDEREACAVLANEAKAGVAAGHTSFKMKVGRGALHMPLEEGTRRDVAVVRAVREAVGPDARLMIDANNGYNYNLAIRVLHETRDCDIWWIEEAFHEDPVLYTHLRSWLRAEGMKTLIADGEGVASPLMLQWALEGAVDCLQFSCREKGFTEWLRLGKLLRDAGRFAAPHNFGSHWTCFAAGHLAAVLGCHVEWDAAERCPALDTSAFGPIRGGRVTLPVDKPGFGIVLNSEALEASPEYWSAE